VRQHWRCALGAVERTAWFLAAILITENIPKLCALMLILCGVMSALHDS
jgi:hypothetical protein